MYIRIATLLLSLGGLLLAADVTGKWTFTGTAALTGTYEDVVGKAPLKGTVEGNKIEFVVIADQGDLKYSGTISSGMQMSGKADYPEIGDASWKATKDK